MFSGAVYFGVFHGLKHAIHGVAKKTGHGRVQWDLEKCGAVAKLNVHPFRSRKTGMEKQVVLAQLAGLLGPDDPEFQAAARDQVGLHPDRRRTRGGVPDYHAWFRFFCRLPSCCEAGPILRFARWGSPPRVMGLLQ